MQKISFRLPCLLLIILFGGNSLIAQQHTQWTKKKSENWFLHGTWRNGLHITPDASINAQEFATQYHRNPYLWKRVFAFLNRADLTTMAPGTYVVVPGDSAYASVTLYKTKPAEATKWESHRKYIDVQYVIKGKEKIGDGSIATATVTDPYNPAKDIAHYNNKGHYYIATPANFFIFFPQETHRPGIALDSGAGDVKKLVIKVMVMK